VQKVPHVFVQDGAIKVLYRVQDLPAELWLDLFKLGHVDELTFKLFESIAKAPVGCTPVAVVPPDYTGVPLEELANFEGFDNARAVFRLTASIKRHCKPDCQVGLKAQMSRGFALIHELSNMGSHGSSMAHSLVTGIDLAAKSDNATDAVKHKIGSLFRGLLTSWPDNVTSGAYADACLPSVKFWWGEHAPMVTSSFVSWTRKWPTIVKPKHVPMTASTWSLAGMTERAKLLAAGVAAGVAAGKAQVSPATNQKVEVTDKPKSGEVVNPNSLYGTGDVKITYAKKVTTHNAFSGPGQTTGDPLKGLPPRKFNPAVEVESASDSDEDPATKNNNAKNGLAKSSDGLTAKERRKKNREIARQAAADKAKADGLPEEVVIPLTSGASDEVTESRLGRIGYWLGTLPHRFYRKILHPAELGMHDPVIDPAQANEETLTPEKGPRVSAWLKRLGLAVLKPFSWLNPFSWF